MISKNASADAHKLAFFSHVAEKRRFNISLPEHIADELERRSKDLGSNPTEYAANIIRWWYGEGSPPLNAEETRVMARKGNTQRAS